MRPLRRNSCLRDAVIPDTVANCVAAVACGAAYDMSASPSGVPVASAWNLTGRTVLLCTMKHGISQFMYLPIIRTLDSGFRSLGAAAVVVTSGHGPMVRSAKLAKGDVLVWVGAGIGVKSLKLRELGARGVRRVLYSTEPMTWWCRQAVPGSNIRSATGGWDETWHYTLHNAQLCWRVAANTSTRSHIHRYVPPGALGVDLFHAPSQTFRSGSTVWWHPPAETAAFLGLIPRNNTPNMPGYARISCFKSLKSTLGSKLVHRDDIFTLDRVRKLIQLHGVFVNLHKDCGVANRPAEAVRFSLLLSAGARIVSERSNPADERAYAGFVNFVNLPDLGQAVEAALAEVAAEPKEAIARRLKAFEQHFAPAAIFALAGLPSTRLGGGDQANIHAIPASHGASGGGPCGGTPFTYRAGSMETPWVESPAAGQICRIAKAQLGDAHAWLAYAAKASGSPWRMPTLREASLLSRFQCGDGAAEWLEPLSGMARHPLAHLGCPLSRKAEVNLYHISYLVLANHCPVRRTAAGRSGLSARIRGGAARPPRRLLFDLGCSWYKKPPLCEYRPKDRHCRGRNWRALPSPPLPPPPSPLSATAHAHGAHMAGSAVGPSLPLFLELYERNCIRFDAAFAWEATRFDPALWWRDVPADVRPRLTFYNEPVSAGSFVEHLLTHARPEDFVALKVDIDGGPEVEIVSEIARRPELAARVDELFFEYHFDFDGIDFGWHIRRPGTRRRFRMDTVSNATVDDALGLMRRLREAGVRSHFWI